MSFRTALIIVLLIRTPDDGNSHNMVNSILFCHGFLSIYFIKLFGEILNIIDPGHIDPEQIMPFPPSLPLHPPPGVKEDRLLDFFGPSLYSLCIGMTFFFYLGVQGSRCAGRQTES